MAKKKKAAADDSVAATPAIDPTDVTDIKLSIQSAQKTVLVHISNPAECAAAAAGSADGELLADLITFAEDILESNDDASKLDITPENAEEVLSSKTAPNLDAAADDAAVSADQASGGGYKNSDYDSDDEKTA